MPVPNSISLRRITLRIVLAAFVFLLLWWIVAVQEWIVPQPFHDFRARFFASSDSSEKAKPEANGIEIVQPDLINDTPAEVKSPQVPGPAPIVPSLPNHSAGDTVRATKSGFAAKIEKWEPVAVDWKNPFSLTFNIIRNNYLYYQVHGAFAPKGLPRIHGGAVTISGAVMPIDPPPVNGELQRFWLANPRVVMAGCVFCNPPTLADLIYIQTKEEPLKVDREELYRGVLVVQLVGRFFVEQQKTADGIEYLFRLELKQVLD